MSLDVRRPVRPGVLEAGQYTAESAKDLLALFRDGGVPLFLVDFSGSLIFASKAAHEVLGPGDLTKSLLWPDVQAVASEALRLHGQDGPKSAWTRELFVGRDVLRLIARAITLSAGMSPAAVAVVAERIGPSVASTVAQQIHARLSEREMEVAELLARGCSNDEIAQRLGISAHTARRHTEHVFDKLGVRTRAAVVALLANG